VGSQFEFEPIEDGETIDFLSPRDFFTDDTILSLAVEDVMLSGCYEAPDAFTHAYKRWFERFAMYPKAGWGSGFADWASGIKGARTNSFGNGAIMRLSAIANMLEGREAIRDAVTTSCLSTHNHERSIEAATILGELISYAKGGADVDTILNIAKARGVNVLSYETERAGHGYTIDVTETLAAALSCLGDSHSYRTAITKAIELKGDADTIAAVVGSLAEHLWGIPQEVRAHVRGKLAKLLDEYPEQGL
jgi:ADP-ribosylglycohydrolase